MQDSDSKKRPLDGDRQISSSKRPNRRQGDTILLKQLIPSALTGVVIGKGGETIMKLQAETGTVIKISQGGDFYPGTMDRICVINGAAEKVRTAHELIWESLHEKHDKLGEELKVKLVVPNCTVGMIIGKGGCYIRQINEETGGHVQISQKMTQDTQMLERVVNISGSPTQMIQAFELVFKMIVEDPMSDSCPNISYTEFVGPAAGGNDFMGPPVPPAVMPNFANPVFLGAAMRPTPQLSTESLRSALRNSGYSFPSSDEITAAVCTLANYGFLGVTVGPPRNNSMSLEEMVAILGGGGNRFPVEPFGFKPASGGCSPFDNGMAGAALGWGSNPRGDGNALAFAAAAAQSFAMNQDNFHEVGKELQVGENIVGAILGQGGRGIVDIQKQTSATIHISKKGVFAPGTHNRIVTIKGSADAVEKAMFKIKLCIEYEENKRKHEQMLK